MNDKRQPGRLRTHDRSRHPRVKLPDVTGTGCDTTSSPGKACYSMADVTGLTATKLVFTKPGQASTSGNGYSVGTSQTSPSPSPYVG